MILCTLNIKRVLFSLAGAVLIGGGNVHDAVADGGAVPARADPIEYVAPELRADLLNSLEARAGSVAFEALTSDSLQHIRQAAKQYEPERLPEPAVLERTIPGLEGAPDVRVLVIGAEEGGSRPAILHMHGGGYILGRPELELPYLQSLATTHDCVIVTVAYRLAPETPFPGALEDNYAALKWLHDNAPELGVDANRIAVMGGSAGGGHAAMLAIAARDRGEVPLAQQILINPMLDDRTGSTKDMPYWMGYGSWSPAANRFGWTSLLGVPAGSISVPRGSVPSRMENLEGLPPTFIIVGSVDLFVDESIMYARRLIETGVPTELVIVPGGYHGFQTASPESTLATQFNAAIDTAIERSLVQEKLSDDE